MSYPELPMPATLHDADELQSLRERISELEGEIANLTRLEDTIQRNNGLFEALLSASQDGIALTTPDARIVRIVKSVLEYGPLTMSGVSIYDIIHPEDRAAMRECYFQLVRQRAHRVCHEVRMLKADGSVVWVEGAVTDMLDDPNVLAIVHNYRDVTQRKQAELAALELAAVIEQAPFAFFSEDGEGNIQSWNSGAERLFGYTTREMIGWHISRLAPPEVQAEESALRAAVVRSGAPVGPLSTVRIHKDGLRIPLELTLTPMIRDGRVRGILNLSRTPCCGCR